MKEVKKYSPEVRERAVRLLLKHRSEYPTEWSAMVSLADITTIFLAGMIAYCVPRHRRNMRKPVWIAECCSKGLQRESLYAPSTRSLYEERSK